MANLLESSQTQATTAPQYFTDYLSNIAKSGTTAAQNAQYIGAQPLQQQAFQQAANFSNTYQPYLTAAGQTLGNAAEAGSPLSAASKYLTAAETDPTQLATQYLNPYTKDVVQSIGEIGRRNIEQNLAPQATAAAVGSGQFGSQRGAQVLGQTIQNANRDILAQQNSALQTGYQNALDAAIKQKTLEGSLGTTAGQLASAGQQNLSNIGTAQGNLATGAGNLGASNLTQLANLGGQQQTIGQNEQLFPLQNLSTLAGLLKGYTQPTTTTTTAQASPLATLGSMIAGGAGMFTPQYDSKGNALGTPFSNLATGLKTGYNTISGLFNSNNPVSNLGEYPTDAQGNLQFDQ